MAKTFNSFYSELTDDELEQAYREYEVWNKTGVLQDGVLRSVYDSFNKENDTEIMIYAIVEPFLRELIKRYRTVLGR